MTATTPVPLARAQTAVATVLALLATGLSTAHWLQPPRPPLARTAVVLRIDPNRASAAELELLPRIGPALAAAIIDHRERAPAPPAFRTLADLDAIRGIGPATLKAIAPHLVLPETR